MLPSFNTLHLPFVGSLEYKVHKTNLYLWPNSEATFAARYQQFKENSRETSVFVLNSFGHEGDIFGIYCSTSDFLLDFIKVYNHNESFYRFRRWVLNLSRLSIWCNIRRAPVGCLSVKQEKTPSIISRASGFSFQLTLLFWHVCKWSILCRITRILTNLYFPS
jgi:hypothetical protein